MKKSEEIKADILVVDDVEINRKLVRKSLSKMYNVREAGSGQEALELVSLSRPDLILLDVHMPGMSGHEVIKCLKDNPDTEDIPVIFMTADDGDDNELVGLKEGADDFVTKPCRPDILIARISRIVELNFLRKNLEAEVERQTATAEERSRRIEQISLQTIQTLAGAIDAKDTYTNGHSNRVSRYAMLIAQAMGWDNERIENLRYAALLHDIGNICIPDTILNSPKRLDEIEFAAIKKHTVRGYEILQNNIMIDGAEDVALHHHERFDGTGYPEGLAGEDISIEARIVSIADAFDAMKSRRLYRKALSDERIREELAEGRATQFDPYLLDIFINLWNGGMLDDVSSDSSKLTSDEIENTSALIQKVMESFVSQNGADEIDIVSGLLSRSFGERAIAGAMQECGGCFIFFDVDNLKKINDVMGHNAGDKALALVGKTVLTYAHNCIACRLGGDEFLMFIKDVNKEEAENRIEIIFEKFTEEKNKNSEIRLASLSAGMVMSERDDIYVDVYNKADKALYHVKQNGKAGYYFYHEDSDETVEDRVDIVKLVDGIKNSGCYEGAMDVEFRQFAKLFEYIANLQKRYNHSFELVLITLKLPNQKVYIDELEQAMFSMEQSIKQTIRNVDVVTRYSSVQFLVILFEIPREEIETVVGRIFADFNKMDNRGFIPEYKIADLPEYESVD